MAGAPKKLGQWVGVAELGGGGARVGEAVAGSLRSDQVTCTED